MKESNDVKTEIIQVRFTPTQLKGIKIISYLEEIPISTIIRELSLSPFDTKINGGNDKNALDKL